MHHFHHFILFVLFGVRKYNARDPPFSNDYYNENYLMGEFDYYMPKYREYSGETIEAKEMTVNR